MKVFLKEDIKNVGMAGEMVKVDDGFGRNYLIPKKLAVEVTDKNESTFKNKIKVIENRKEVINSKSSMLAERINSIVLTLKRKVHDDGKLYAAVNTSEIADLLAEQGIAVGKSQVLIEKSIKEKGSYKVTIKLTSTLQPQITLKVVPDYVAKAA